MKKTLMIWLVGLTAACGAPLKPATEAELAKLQSDEKAPIEEARAGLDANDEKLAALRGELAGAERQVEIAEYRIRREQAAVEIARLEFEAAQETKDADAMIPARAARRETAAALEEAEAALAVNEAELEQLEARIEQALATVEVARAELGLAQVRAVQASSGESDRPGAVERRAAFETRVAEAKASLAAEKQTVARLTAQLERARQAWEKTRADDAGAEAVAVDGDQDAATASPAEAASNDEAPASEEDVSGDAPEPAEPAS